MVFAVYLVGKGPDKLLRGPLVAPNPNLQVVIALASHGLPLRMYEMHRMHFDHARLDISSLAI